VKIKTSELSGIALDWAVAKSEEVHVFCMENLLWTWVVEDWKVYSHSSDWSQGRPIIEREKIDINFAGDWSASYNAWTYKHGDTPLIAAMRCYVASKLGEDVDVPDELLEEVK